MNFNFFKRKNIKPQNVSSKGNVVAVGLSYEENKNAAPALSVKGFQGEADEIVRLAKKYGVPIVEEAELASMLSTVEEGESIPEELFEIAAEVLVAIDKNVK